MQVACGYTIPITLFGIPPSPADHLKALDIVGRAGFKSVEFEFYDQLLAQHQRDLEEMRAILSQYAMTVPSVMAVEESLFSLDPAVTRKALDDFDALTDLVVELDAPLVSICGYMPPEIRPKGTELYVGGPPTSVSVDDDFSWPRFWSNAVAVVAHCAAVAKRKDLDLIVETRANDVFGSTDAIINLIRDSGADNMGVILDVAHVHAGKEYLPLAIRKLGRLIKLVHLSDNDGTQAYHYPPGRGTIDFAAVIQDLERVGFDGTLVVDISGVDNIVQEAVNARYYFEMLFKEPLK